MGEILNNTGNFIECRLDDTDSNNNLILINPKFLPTPKLKLNYYNNSKSPKCNFAQTVTKFSPPKEKGSGAKGALKNKAVETASVAFPIHLCHQNQCWPTQILEQQAHTCD